MFVRKVRRRCGVRGCRNTDCYAISRSREIGNSVIVCKRCLGEALGDINKLKQGEKSNLSNVAKREIPSLFFNAKAMGTGDDKRFIQGELTTPPSPVSDTTEPEDTENNPSTAEAVPLSQLPLRSAVNDCHRQSPPLHRGGKPSAKRTKAVKKDEIE